MKRIGEYSTSDPLGDTQICRNVGYCDRATVPHRDEAMNYCRCGGYSRNLVVATQHFHVESGERVTMSSCPGARGSTVSTSNVGAGLVVEKGGAVVGGAGDDARGGGAHAADAPPAAAGAGGSPRRRGRPAAVRQIPTAAVYPLESASTRAVYRLRCCYVFLSNSSDNECWLLGGRERVAAAEQQAERTRLAHDAQLATTEQKEAELQALRVAKEEEVPDGVMIMIES